jgi:GNAT superfamily N-acetyltransferase
VKYKLVTTIERKDLIGKGDEIVVAVWPEFILHDAVANEYFFQLYEVFPEFQYWLLDGEEIVGIGNSIPILWKYKLNELPEEGWDWALEKGFRDKEKDRIPNILCTMSITINPKYQGKGVSKEMINAMVRIGKNFHLDYLVVPVRPTLKKDYPLVDMKRYINWNRDDGLPFDP